MSTSNEMIASVGKNIQEKTTLIWNIADTLRGPFKPHEYGLVIIPMTVIKRFHDCLLDTWDAVVETNKEIGHLAVKDGFLRAAAQHEFYNTSKYTFEKLKADPENIEDNFQDFLNGFSDNVTEILAHMDFQAQVKRMTEAGILYQVIVEFCSPKAYMGIDKVSTVDMGYIFEELVRKFSESYDEEAGAHFTSRDIIYLMCDLLVTNDPQVFDGKPKTVYDMTMGTSQMLTCMKERLLQMDSEMDVLTYGQEVNPFTAGIAQADDLIHGGDAKNMVLADTLSDDRFGSFKFSYTISNPPFGVDWKKEAPQVEAEFKKGEAGRFAPGLPPKSDGQLLFMLNGISKLKPNGRMAIIQNGSSLFSGDAGSGQSEIRRYIIENDWLDAIIQIGTGSFYNTGIATYIWLISKDRDASHAGRVQLIDASGCSVARRKNIGNKRVDITDACRDLIVQVYGDYKEGTFTAAAEDGSEVVVKSKIMDSVSLGYNKITVESPLLDEKGQPVLKKDKPVADTSKRDTETVPLDQDVDDYFKREVLPYNAGAWIDVSKTKVGYEIPFTRVFYEYKELEPADVIADRIRIYEKRLMDKLDTLFGEE